jgi:hypothetical protein
VRACTSFATLLALMTARLGFCAIPATPEVPAWLQTQVGAPLPDHEADTNAVTLYAAKSVVVQPDGKITRTERVAYRILRPDGTRRGVMSVSYNSRVRITALHGWSIPATGKPYIIDDKQAFDTALAGTLNGLLMSDLRNRVLRVPAEPGSIVGFEVVLDEDKPYIEADDWVVQDAEPVAETHYSLQLPPGWQFKATWLNHDEVPATAAGPGHWQWDVSGVRPIRIEQNMPPLPAVAGHMVISLLAANGTADALGSWHELGLWYLGLTQGRREPSAEIKRRSAELTATAPTLLAKMQVLAEFVQNNIRYVGIELGVGGYQPHLAAEVYAHGYGDCKDKVILLSSMLKEIGVDSYYVLINSERGAITGSTPAHLGFDHAILAIQLPAAVDGATLLGVQMHPKLGRILFFDPTNFLTPLGRLDGRLQGGYGLLVTPDGGELLQLPQQLPQVSGVQRHMQMTLDETGTLRGDVDEHWTGDAADSERARLRSPDAGGDRIKLVEPLVADSLSRFQITKATVDGQSDTGKPLEWHYSLQADRFAKSGGDLLLVRPRLLGVYASGLLETEKPRQNPIEFGYLMHASDVFDITLPPGYVADDLPPPVDADYDFASYHSSSKMVGNVLRYSRTYEIKALSVPATQAEELRQLYRTITGDERQQATLKGGVP